LSEKFELKVGIIGCGQLGTMILTKLLETRGNYSFLYQKI